VRDASPHGRDTLSRGCGPDAGRVRDAYAGIREWRLVIRGRLAQD